MHLPQAPNTSTGNSNASRNPEWNTSARQVADLTSPLMIQPGSSPPYTDLMSSLPADINDQSPLRSNTNVTNRQNRNPLPKRLDAVPTQQRGSAPNRVSRACNRCRRAKTKCSGTDPCRACQSIDQECIYSTGKVELQKRLLCSSLQVIQ